MKLSKEFVLREIAGNYIVVPFGEKAVNFNAMITLNETGAFLWKKIEEGKSKEELLSAILEEYEVDREKAKEDIEKFCEKLKSAGILEL
ncbi:PqqD family protein [Acetivibrio clariflavus]|uniref:Coenzyme PQQ synthesis protein D (PqqD) n=1 Tax=Acetivibrio clariflavus (strain DSM 19732 / NBRC 101661 / EBR45) TaxID=720554 RepID=G8LWM0_ACECE|nr:PqqD family protein [Acetivibrio clariflavus]AEV68688.1 Coenzyme PQQ synthesis protein D (PqqD) [Acetivibrio clariflavus DSM 19732]